jgi:hypothetical protein
MLKHQIASNDLMSLFLIEERMMKDLVPYNEDRGREVLTGYIFGENNFTLNVYIQTKV